jgi:ABC-type antimicrobial peptide transport system permease subunit
VYDVRTLAEQQRRSMVSERVVAWLSGLAAAIALLLSAIGLYGLVSFDAQLRTHEIGVRISLGATRSRIMALVLRGVLALLVAGTLGGLALSLALSKLVSAQLYGVSPRDVTVAAAACAILSATAFSAASLPAWRAAGTTPLNALRCE